MLWWRSHYWSDVEKENVWLIDRLLSGLSIVQYSGSSKLFDQIVFPGNSNWKFAVVNQSLNPGLKEILQEPLSDIIVSVQSQCVPVDDIIKLCTA